MLSALPYPNNLTFSAMFSTELHALDACSFEDRKRQRIEQSLAARLGHDRDNVVFARKIRLFADVSCSHNDTRSLKRKATLPPAPHAPLAAGGESAGCNIFADKIKLNSLLTADFCAFRESPLRQLAERTRA